MIGVHGAVIAESEAGVLVLKALPVLNDGEISVPTHKALEYTFQGKY